MSPRPTRAPEMLAAFMRRYSDTAALMMLGAAVALVFWPTWVMGYRFPMGGGDLWSQLYPVWSYVAEWVSNGIFPLWSTRIMGGDPIISEPQAGLLNPLNWPLFLSNSIPAWLVSARVLFSLWLAGAGLYLYLRRSPVWQLGIPAALTGAIAFMFSDPFFAHLGHPQFNDTLAWLPWILWGVDATVRRRAGIVPTALAAAALLLAGHGQAALYAVCFIVAYALWQAIQTGRGHRSRIGRSLGRLALTAMLAGAIAAPGLFPAMERLPHTDRAIMPPNLGEYEFHLGMWRDFVTPLYHGRNMKTFWGHWERVETGYIGFAALGLAVLGLFSGPVSRRFFLSSGSATTVIFALGTKGPIYPIIANLPLFDATWKTGRAIYLLSFVLAMAAGAGTELLLSRNLSMWKRLIALFGFAGVAALVACQSPTWAALAPNADAVSRASTALHFAVLMLVCVASLGTIPQRHLIGRVGLVLVVLSELVVTGAWADIEPRPREEQDPHTGAITYLRADTGWFRVDIDGAARGLWSPASVMAAGFDVPQGTGNPMELVAYNQFYWGIPHKGMPAYHLLGTKYIIVPKGAHPGAEGIWPVYIDDPLIDIHLNTHALPRAWLVYTALPVERLEDAYARVFSPDFDPSTTATVTGGPELAATGSGRIEVLAYGPNRAAFCVETDAPALLVLSDLLYPGWQASVDRKRAPIYATDGLFRGVVIPAGTHTVDMRFRSISLRLGVGGLGVGLLMIGHIYGQYRVKGPGRDDGRRSRTGGQKDGRHS